MGGRGGNSKEKISNEKIKQKKMIQRSDGLDPIEQLKLYTDTKDKLLIYMISIKNNQYVFKTSTDMMKIAGDMNVEGDDSLSGVLFFDGNHNRVCGYATLTASMHNPLLQRQIILTTMQCKHENKKFVEIFWRVLNKT